MVKKYLSYLIVAGVLGLFTQVFFHGQILAKEVYRLKIQSGYPRGDISMQLLNNFAALAKEKSNGQLMISVFAAPEIVTVGQLFQATQRGTLDMLHAGGTFWGGIVPVGEIEFGVPYGFRIPEIKSFEKSAEAIRGFFFEKGFADLLRQEYAKHDLHWLDIHTYGPVPTVLATKCIRTMEDLKGVKIRDEGIWTKWHNMVGARGTDISPEETYMALKLGTLDATQWDVGAITSMNWHEVAPYWIRGEENDHAIGHIMVNMETWNSLPQDLQQVLQEAAKAYFYMTVEAYKKEFEKAKEVAKTDELEECWLTDKAIAEHRKAARKVWEDMAQEDEASKKALEMLQEWKAGF